MGNRLSSGSTLGLISEAPYYGFTQGVWGYEYLLRLADIASLPWASSSGQHLACEYTFRVGGC
jgi:hypothetical protein